jgi:hypothetical protein
VRFIPEHIQDALATLGCSRRVAVSIQAYALTPVILAHSDCICTLPWRFLTRFTRELDLTPPPLDLPPAHCRAVASAEVMLGFANAYTRQLPRDFDLHSSQVSNYAVLNGK